MELLTAVQGARAIANFVEGGPLANALADLGIAAARSAMSKALYAEDKRAQVWSAVNHLEQAEAALDSTLKKYGGVLMATRFTKAASLENKHRYVLALMAICYRYLGEKDLTDRTCRSIQAVGVPMKWYHWGALPVTACLLLAHYADQELISRPGRYLYDDDTFVRRLNASWEEGPRELLSVREYGL